MVADLPTLKRHFARALEKLTKRETESLRTRIRNAQDGDKRDVFDDGLCLWAESLAECASEYLEDHPDFPEDQAWTDVGDFLGIDFSTEPSQWPERNRVRRFILETCSSGPRLPKWFLGKILRIGVKEETARMEATADLDAAIKRIDTQLARLDEQRTEKQEVKAPAGAWDGLIPAVLADSAKLTGSANEPRPIARLSEDESARLAQAAYDGFAKFLFGLLVEDASFDTSPQEDRAADDAQGSGDIEPHITPGETPISLGTFAREGDTWAIEYGGDKCRLAAITGLDYISALLRYAGTRIGAKNLRAERALAVPVDLKNVIDLSHDSDSEEALDSDTRVDFDQPDESPQDYLDQTAIAQAKERIAWLIAAAKSAEDRQNSTRDPKEKDLLGQQVKEFRKEQRDIQDELKKKSNRFGKPRHFSNQQERARTTVKKAIDLALSKIERGAPITARHLRDNIKTGADLVYRDCSVRWTL